MKRSSTDLTMSGAKVRRLFGSRKLCIFSRTAPAKHDISASISHWADCKRSVCAFPAFCFVMVWMNNTRWTKICCLPSFISSKSRQMPLAAFGTPPRSHRLLRRVSLEKAAGMPLEGWVQSEALELSHIEDNHIGSLVLQTNHNY